MSRRLAGTSAGQVCIGLLHLKKEEMWVGSQIFTLDSAFNIGIHDFDKDLEGLLYNLGVTGKEIAVTNRWQHLEFNAIWV